MLNAVDNTRTAHTRALRYLQLHGTYSVIIYIFLLRDIRAHFNLFLMKEVLFIMFSSMFQVYNWKWFLFVNFASLYFVSHCYSCAKIKEEVYCINAVILLSVKSIFIFILYSYDACCRRLYKKQIMLYINMLYIYI